MISGDAPKGQGPDWPFGLFILQNIGLSGVGWIGPWRKEEQNTRRSPSAPVHHFVESSPLLDSHETPRPTAGAFLTMK